MTTSSSSMYEWYNGNWQRESSLGSRGGENNSENIEIFRNKEAQKWPLTNQEKMIKTNTKLLGEKGGENNI